MPTPTYDLITSNTLSTDASSVSFASISSSYKDIILIIEAGCTTTAELYCQLNNDTSSNYFWVTAGGNGSTTISQTSGGSTNGMRFTERGTYTSSNLVQHTIHFLDYSVTDKHKIVLVRNNAPAAGTSLITTRYASTDAITTILLYPNSGQFTSGSTFYLYGIVG